MELVKSAQPGMGRGDVGHGTAVITDTFFQDWSTADCARDVARVYLVE